MKIPSDNRWTQTNEGDILGVLHSSSNITLDDKGKLTLSKKSFSIYNSGDDAQLANIISILYFNSKYYVTTSDGIFNGNLTTGAFSQISGDPDTTVRSDAIVYNGKYHVTTADDLSSYTGSSWANSLASLTSGVPHPMAVFSSQSTFTLAIGNGNKVQLYDVSYNKSATDLVIPTDQEIRTIRYRNGYLYIGTKNTSGGEAKVYIWNGTGAGAQYEAPVGASWVYSMTEYGTSVMAMTSQGQMGLISGSSFVTDNIPPLPIYYRQDLSWQGSGTERMYNRAMTTVGKRIYLVIDGRLDVGFLPEMKGGLWVSEPNVGLYNRSTSVTDAFVLDSGIALANSVITTSVAHNLVEGDVVMFVNKGSLTGVDKDVPYYANIQGTTKLKLARSRKALKKGTTITIGGTVGSATFLYTPNTDFGDTSEARAGVVAPTVYNEAMETIWQSEVVWGNHSENKVGSSFFSVNLFSDNFNIGGFETQRIYSPNIEQMWNSLYPYIDGLLSDVEQILFKYRVDKKEESAVIQGVWGSANTIHSLSATQDEDVWEDIEEGFELVITDGTGRGYSTHVTNIDTSSDTFVVTVDENLGTLNDSVFFYFTNYKKLQVKTNVREKDGLFQEAIDTSGGWLQIKSEMRGFQIATKMMELTNKKHK